MAPVSVATPATITNGINGTATTTRKRDWYDWLLLGVAVIGALYILDRMR